MKKNGLEGQILGTGWVNLKLGFDTAIETVVQTGLNYLFRHKMNFLPGQPIKTAWASSFNA